MSVLVVLLASGCVFSGSGQNSAELDGRVAGLVSGAVTAEPAPASAKSVPLSGGYVPAIRAAVLSNHGYTASLREIRQAQATVRASQSALRPQLTGNVMAGGVATRENGSTSTETGLGAGLNLSQLLYDGGESVAGIDATTARAYSTVYLATAQANEIGLAAASAWIDLWQYSQQMALVDSRLAEVRPLLSRIDSLIANGLGDRADIASARRQFLDLELERLRIEAALDDAANRFSRYFGQRPGKVSTPENLFSADKIYRMGERWTEAPRLIATAAEIISAQHELEAAKARLKPQVVMQVGADSPTSQDDDPELSAGLSLRYTFGDGGRRKADVTAREERVAALQFRLDDLRAQTRSEFDSLIARYRSLEASMKMLNQRIAALEDEKDTLYSQLSSGQSTMRQLVETEVLYYRALSDQIALRGERLRLELALSASAGTLLKRLGIDIETGSASP